MEFVVFSLVVFSVGGLIAYVNWRNEKYNEWLMLIGAAGGKASYIYRHQFQYTIDTPFSTENKWQKSLLFITHKRMAVYHYPKLQPAYTLQLQELRGFWRPQKYTEGNNEMWIHAQIGVTWHIIKLRLYKSQMQKLVRAMKAIATEAQTKAYRRRRPYIHRDPVPAHPAKQNLHGAWELDAPVNLYIMPLHLVIFHGEEVYNSLDLTTVQNIAALKRMEGGKPDGLVRFTAGEEEFAFALDDYEAWASDLAEAAKRTLEEPVERKRKGKDDEDDDE